MNYSIPLPELDAKLYTNYFLHEFLPSHNFEVEVRNKTYVHYKRKDFLKDQVISNLDLMLQSQYKFPPIEYFSVFKHTEDQHIHIDGLEIPRLTSLNLPLRGYESTKTLFYKKNSNVTPSITNANYYSPSDVELVSELEGKNEWTLIDSGSPHNVVNIDPTNPRYTLCIRFFTNPSISFLTDRINGPA